MLAAAAAAAAAEAAARNAAELPNNLDVMERESMQSPMDAGWNTGDGMGYDPHTEGDPGHEQALYPEDIGAAEYGWEAHDGMVGGMREDAYAGGVYGDQVNDLNPISAMSSILQQMAAEEQCQQEQQETQPMLQDQQELQQQLQQQLQEQLQQQLAAAAAAAADAEAMARIKSRPDEHFLTIAQNGTILGATETVTGIPAESLLMNSAFDSVHHEDIICLQAIATRFWEKGHPEIEAYFRRQTVEDDWVWLVAKVVSFIDEPVPGLVLQECRVKDENRAYMISRSIRIPALIINAVEEAHLAKESEAESSAEAVNSNDPKNNRNFTGASAIPGVADDAAALQALLENSAEGGIDLNDFIDCNGVNPLQQLMEAAASGGAMMDNPGSTINCNQSQNSDPTAYNSFSVMEMVRQGICLDLSKVLLTPDEVKFVTLVLTGRLSIEDVGPIIYQALNSGKDLGMAFEDFTTLRESQQSQQDDASQSREKTKRSNTGGRDTPSHRISRSFVMKKSSDNVADFPQRRQSFGNALFEDAKEFVQRRRNFGNTPNSQIVNATPSYPQQQMRPPSPIVTSPPPLSVVNLSYTNIGSEGFEMLCEILFVDSPFLKTIDIGFCSVEERGMIALSRAIRKRKKRGLPFIQGLVLSGNIITYKAAKELGMALSPMHERKDKRALRKRSSLDSELGTGYDEDDEFDDDEEDEVEDDVLFGGDFNRNKKDSFKPPSSKMSSSSPSPSEIDPDNGLRLLHMACTSISPEALYQLLIGLGQDCPIREFNISSNNLGPAGANFLVSFLEGKGIAKYKRGKPVMSSLDRLDMTNNNLGNDGTAKLTRAISKRVNVNIVDLRLSCNNIGAAGIETIMNKLLQHNLVSLSLDNNTIADRGCQLVAASLTSMHHLSHLNLSFNQIGSRGVTALMRALVGCESMTSLGLSGNVMKISGAIAMGFALAQHPRLAELNLDNCCLSQVAQCHVVAGIISNRWVPMRHLVGFQVGPPMVAIGALDAFGQSLTNEECFRIRRDIQMKTILQWMENKRNGAGMNDVDGTPSQSAYLRMLDWLSKIPFDEDELTDLRKYFYDDDGGDSGDGMRGSDGQINLKHRGDLLAALGSDVVEEIRDNISPLETSTYSKSFVGLNLDTFEDDAKADILEVWDIASKWENRNAKSDTDGFSEEEVSQPLSMDACDDTALNASGNAGNAGNETSGKKRRMSGSFQNENGGADQNETGVIDSHSMKDNVMSTMRSHGAPSSMSSMSKTSNLSRSESEKSQTSIGEGNDKKGRLKPRIAMFPPFATKLENLKAQAQELMDQEHDPVQQDIIAQLFAEASLTLLRQLRYHCMNNGLDGWRQGKIRRKILIVDDSMVTRKMVSRAFEKANFIVDTAEDGQEGVAKLKESIYDIAFMDIDMPVMNGFDATKALRAWEDIKRPGARQPICALTAAYVDDFERTELLKYKEAGLDVMESKPCNIPRLFKVVDDVSPMFSDLSISVTNFDANQPG